MANADAGAGREQALGAGSFYGAVEARRERCGAIFTNLRHAVPRKLPSHAHELAFFAVLLEGEYGERYQRRDRQFRPFTVHFRPAGVPHQDEVGPRGVRFFEIEIRPSWRERLAECSAVLDLAHDDCEGGRLLWLGMKMFRQFQGAAGADEVDESSVETLLFEMLAEVALMRREKVTQAPAWLGRILEKLAADYRERLTLDELGREAGVHPVHLSRVFRKFVGDGIGEYVHRLRIRAACEAMLAPEISLAEISLAVGFADQSHLTRVFRRATGMTPAGFRECALGG
ncbi:MAG: helix-turn-helix transcriptional regulator [Terriglobales bacterium]|jgi:AraC family transcriptional regulator